MIEKNYLNIEHNDIEINVNIKIGDLDNITFYNPYLFKLINKYKTCIESINENWDNIKKLSNDYELISNPSDNINSIAKYKPLSRSYYKLFEINKDFNIIPTKKKIKYAGLAEAPGGFIECIYKFRRNLFLGLDDERYCITLVEQDSHIPNFKKLSKLINDTIISNGSDGTGNLYKLENIKYFRKQVGYNTVDLVTADGGFDYTNGYESQEISSRQLIFCETVQALSINCKGGSFVLKIFDICTQFMLELIIFLSKYYDEVNCIKPFTSRPANSEKYLVCKNYRGIDDNMLNRLYEIVDVWDKLPPNKTIDTIFNISNTLYYPIIDEYNNIFTINQIENILKTLILSKIKLRHNDLKYIKAKQAVHSIEWCFKYDVEINLLCKYIKNNFININ